MDPVQSQLGKLCEIFPDATLEKKPDGAYIVVVPNVALPDGWNKPITNVFFVAPVGYPVARPDCFWTDNDLALAHGGSPANSGQNQTYGLGDKRWFSYHLASWNPNEDDLLKYMRLIQTRLSQPH